MGVKEEGEKPEQKFLSFMKICRDKCLCRERKF